MDVSAHTYTCVCTFCKKNKCTCTLKLQFDGIEGSDNNWYAFLRFSTLSNTLLKFARFKKIMRNYTFCILHNCKNFIQSLYCLIKVIRPERRKNLKVLLLIYLLSFYSTVSASSCLSFFYYTHNTYVSYTQVFFSSACL